MLCVEKLAIVEISLSFVLCQKSVNFVLLFVCVDYVMYDYVCMLDYMYII